MKIEQEILAEALTKDEFEVWVEINNLVIVMREKREGGLFGSRSVYQAVFKHYDSRMRDSWYRSKIEALKSLSYKCNIHADMGQETPRRPEFDGLPDSIKPEQCIFTDKLYKSYAK